VMYRTLHQDPDLSGVPKPVRPLVAWCLAKPPGDRPSAAEVLAYADGLAMGLFELEHAAFMASMAAVAAWHGWISDDDRTGAVGAVGAVGTVQSAGLPVHTELGPAPVPAEFGALPGAEPTVVTPLATPPPPPPPPPPGDEDESSGEAVAVAVAVAVPWWAAKSPFTPSPPTVAERRGPGAGANSGTRDSPGDSSGPGWVPGEPAKADEPKGRHLTAVLPERAPSSTRISLIVMITLASRQSPSAPLKSFVVAPTGTSVTVTVSAPGLSASGDLEQELFVPYSEDSEPIRFGFSTRRPGLHTVVVRAFAGGTFLGELALQISVESGAALEEGRGRVAVLAGLAAEPGEVTLQVSRTEENRYSFQLIGDALYPVEFTKRLAGDPTQVVSALVEELRAMSARESRFASPALIRNRIRNLGAQLWSDVVPDAGL